MGTDKAKIHARFKKRYSNMVKISSPFPKNRSTALRRKLTKRMKVIIPKEKINGSTSSLIKYLDKSRMAEITKIDVEISIVYSFYYSCSFYNFPAV
jgi:hypothetical protein|tara:strand:+ start:365 stop:652 length:288 start_codon:yes stop_codon:yes gene_type:complete